MKLKEGNEADFFPLLTLYDMIRNSTTPRKEAFESIVGKRVTALSPFPTKTVKVFSRTVIET